MDRVILREEDHKYINLDNLDYRYMSVTTVLGLYEQPFDAEYHSKRISDRDGIPQQDILDEWTRINKVAIDYGNMVHKIMERHFLNKQNMYIPRDPFELMLIEEFAKLGVLNNHRIVKPEYILTDPVTETYGIAGTGDLIEDVDDNSFNVWDFKTNKVMTFGNDYGEWMKFPLSHLSQSKFHTYCLQLSTYAYFYERESGKKVNKIGILYWNRGEELESTVGFWEIMYLPYLKTDVKIMIDHFTSVHLPKLIAAL